MEQKIPFIFKSSPYELISKKSVRNGAILRFTFKDGLIGYGDCHPWSELGDLPLDHHLAMLKQGEFTSLTSQSFRFACLDAEARSAGINLLKGLSIPRSNYLVTNFEQLTIEMLEVILKKGFSHLKVKLGRNVELEIEMLTNLMGSSTGKLLKWRLDFNTRLSHQEFNFFLERMNCFLELIDYMEDPFPYDPSAWSTIQSQHGISLASDKESVRALGAPDAARVLILKPAIHSEELFLRKKSPDQRIVVTSYLDHPLGQVCAAYIAAKMSLNDVCGLLTHYIYEINAFSSCLSQGTPHFHPVPGTGFGFDELWTKGT